jgi:hypothetical protein
LKDLSTPAVCDEGLKEPSRQKCILAIGSVGKDISEISGEWHWDNQVSTACTDLGLAAPA